MEAVDHRDKTYASKSSGRPLEEIDRAHPITGLAHYIIQPTTSSAGARVGAPPQRMPGRPSAPHAQHIALTHLLDPRRWEDSIRSNSRGESPREYAARNAPGTTFSGGAARRFHGIRVSGSSADREADG